MGLTVRQLINKLRKMPPESMVVWQDHDHYLDEYNDFVCRVDDVTEYLSSDPENRYVALRG